MPAEHDMPSRDALPTDDRAALDGSGCLGAWMLDLCADRVGLSAPLGRRLDLLPQDAAGLPLAKVLGAIHVEDRVRLESLLFAAFETGDPFEAEFRAGTGARLRLMGRMPAGSAGAAMRMHGLAFDLTASRIARGDPARQARHRVNRIAGHVVALKDLVAGLDNPAVAALTDRLAVEIGYELARRLREAEGGRRQ